ncbi:MAG TPA: hypothetical protein VHB50_16645 [Bryobacteraceae bacterium]|nr:hypothetical protein [Bryobacteraceae bacterium]
MKLAFLLLAATLLPAEEGWWMKEPIRWVQTNLRETDAAADPVRLAGQLADMQANVVLTGMGGIVAYYPTRVEFHYASPWMPPGRDMFGELLREAHARRIRVVGRYDFSKTQKAVYDAHPEWFFRKADGQPVIYNGLYSTCINGGYYREQAMKILAEGLDRYNVDSLFFNMFGNQSTDYSGKYVGLCHCDNCQKKFRQMYGREIPDKPDDDYRNFLLKSSREVSEAVGRLIREKRPHAGYFNYMQDFTDGIMSESNTAVRRPLPLWPLTASDNVNRARNSEPEKMSIDLNMQFVDYWWRFATVPREEIASRMWQDLANGGALTFEVNGTLDQQDRQAVETAKPIFRWAADNEQYYVGQQSAARVLLLGNPDHKGSDESSYRGVFRLLTEEHIPFAVSDNMKWLGKRPFDLVIATGWAPAELRKYVEDGGRLLLLGARPPAFPLARVVSTTADMKGYIRVRNHSRFPSLKDTDLLMLDGPFTEVEGNGAESLSLVPPSMIGPPEKIHIDMKDTSIPGVVTASLGKGTATWVPWDLGGLYYRHSLPAHAALFHDAVDQLHPERLLKTNAHPLVEITLMNQKGRKLVHLVNLSGHSDTGYFAPLPMQNIRIDVAGEFRRARTVRNAGELKLTRKAGYTEMIVPTLADYELIVLE